MMKCWCGNNELVTFSDDYMRCTRCQTLISNHWPEKDVARVDDDKGAFYGSDYWFSHQEKDLGQPNVVSRARTDLPERCLHWLETLLKYKLPPARVIELGSAHGGFVAMLRLAGFEASGLELSPWIVDFAKKTFDVPMLLGPIEDQKIEPGSLDVIALMDVLEHLADPVSTMKHCLNLLKPGGILLIQTPRFPVDNSYEQMKDNDDSFLRQLKENEHLFLFSEESVRKFFQLLGAEYIEFEPAIFSHYDMFLAVSRKPLDKRQPQEVETSLASRVSGRFVQALLDLREEIRVKQELLSVCESDRAARLAVIERQGREFGAKIEKMRNELGSREAEIEAIRSSASWKITAPLRWISGRLAVRGKR